MVPFFQVIALKIETTFYNTSIQIFLKLLMFEAFKTAFDCWSWDSDWFIIYFR